MYPCNDLTRIRQETICVLSQSKLHTSITKSIPFEPQSMSIHLVMEIEHKKSIVRKFCYCACIIPREIKKSLGDTISQTTTVHS